MKTFIVAALCACSAFGVNAATTNCSDAEQSVKYTIDYADGGAPRRSLIELTLNAKVLYKTTFDGNNEIKIANYSFDSATQKVVSTSIDPIKKEQTSLYLVRLVVSSLIDAEKYSDFVICKNVRSFIPIP